MVSSRCRPWMEGVRGWGVARKEKEVVGKKTGGGWVREVGRSAQDQQQHEEPEQAHPMKTIEPGAGALPADLPRLPDRHRPAG